MNFHLGQKVRHRGTGEVGVIVALWTDVNGDTDTYVAFFGTEFPIGQPNQIPYVLRYFSTTLEIVE